MRPALGNPRDAVVAVEGVPQGPHPLLCTALSVRAVLCAHVVGYSVASTLPSEPRRAEGSDRTVPGGTPMKRLTMSLDDDLAEAFEALVRERGYQNRSEAFRDLLRRGLGEMRRLEQPSGPCVAALSYLYNHHERQLALRLTDAQHKHHEITISALHAHLDHDHCIETVLLKGPTDEVQAFAQSVIAQPGVSHGHLHLVPVSLRHAHGHDHVEPAAHAQPSPRMQRRNTSGQKGLKPPAGRAGRARPRR